VIALASVEAEASEISNYTLPVLSVTVNCTLPFALVAGTMPGYSIVGDFLLGFQLFGIALMLFNDTKRSRPLCRFPQLAHHALKEESREWVGRRVTNRPVCLCVAVILLAGLKWLASL
jgi:hypothetical protein